MNIYTCNQEHSITNQSGILNIMGNSNRIGIDRFKGIINILGQHNIVEINMSEVHINAGNRDNKILIRNSQVGIDIKNYDDGGNTYRSDSQKMWENKENVDTGNFIN